MDSNSLGTLENVTFARMILFSIQGPIIHSRDKMRTLDSGRTSRLLSAARCADPRGENREGPPWSQTHPIGEGRWNGVTLATSSKASQSLSSEQNDMRTRRVTEEPFAGYQVAEPRSPDSHPAQQP